MNNATKAVLSIVVIIAAAFFLYRQLSGPKLTPHVITAEEQAKLDAVSQAVQETLDAAIQKASASGWDSTGAFWAPGRYAQSKALLNKVFGKSFNAADVKDIHVDRDSETSAQSATFDYQGTTYVFLMAEQKSGKFLLASFGYY